ncbi:hypothetical protein, variant [Microbotryum lychnidis-dioicae p1A1 Lamole]|uniref:Uncharacterized protein n=1 Tax=Microbotryum lychnidis-dioicae (strain p1A1 Lamole / MvSl-1064) TaxID=683840 RepID=U5HIZ5_USTV1|nr:hypothetical protein, variant [Microbotryum lychnidis-dioicae p1A1 Lamole]|eukprot:KDE02456.1 hypothetical protein, variant [Microbotryum lychnidis-dioicae p1A1 Lamole]
MLTILGGLESRRTLSRRDVVGRDRQDDNATHRAFSKATLELVTELAEDKKLDPDAVVYLLCGELHDAIQNWSLQPLERIRMLLVVRYTFEAWYDFVRSRPGSSSHSFLAKETLDGVRKMVDSTIAFVRNYRDFWPKESFIPWRHGTEMVEHFFGGIRQIVKEFDALEFLQATGKVTALLELMRKFKTEAAGSRQGYHHTYNDLDDLDLVAMRTYPSDGDVSLTSFAAANTARELLSGLRMWEPVQRIASNRRNQGPQPDILVEDVLAHGTTVQDLEDHHPTKEDQGLLRTELLDSALDGLRRSTCQGVVKLDPNEREAVDRAIRLLAALDFDVEAAL